MRLDTEKGGVRACKDDGDGAGDGAAGQGIEVHGGPDQAEQQRTHDEAPEPADMLLDAARQMRPLFACIMFWLLSSSAHDRTGELLMGESLVRWGRSSA